MRNSLLSFFAIAMLMSACGPVPPSSQLDPLAQGRAISASLSSIAAAGSASNASQNAAPIATNSQSTWNCPAYPNVNGAVGAFTVCSSAVDANQILVSAQIPDLSVCVFPQSYASPKNTNLKCFTTAAGTSWVLDFGSARPTSVAITRYGDAAAYLQFLSGSAPRPSYSEGFVQ